MLSIYLGADTARTRTANKRHDLGKTAIEMVSELGNSGQEMENHQFGETFRSPHETGPSASDEENPLQRPSNIFLILAHSSTVHTKTPFGCRGLAL